MIKRFLSFLRRIKDQSTPHDLRPLGQIENDREKLIRELERKNMESETLRRSLANIVGTLEFSEILERILAEIRQVIPYDTASVWHLEGSQQHIITGVDLPPERARAILDEHSFARQSGRKPGEANPRSFLRKGIVGDWRAQFSA